MRTLLAVLVLVPAIALAQPANPSSPPAPEWSIGAGVSTGYLLSLGGVGAQVLSYPYYLYLNPTLVPGVTASLERAVSDSAWIVFGFSAAAQRERYEPSLPPTAVVGSALRRQDHAEAAVEVGLRGVVTPPNALVAVSWLASVEAGFSHSTATVG